MGIPDMAAKGRAKLDRKAARMSTSWNAAKPRMKSGYAAVGFGPTRQANYSSGIDAATHKVDAAKWERNWSLKMAE